NHHLFQPLLYQVATSALAAPDIAAPLRKLLRKQKNARVLMADALDIDVEAKTVTLDDGLLHYDYLVVATGMKNNYFGHDEWEAHAPGLKTLHEALDIRSRVLRAYEAAERETDRARQKELLTFVVIGAGPTGVEMAGALSEIAHRTLARDFDHFDPDKDARVVLVEGGPRVLAAFSEESSRAARASLEELGVEVRTDTFVKEVDDRGVTVGEGERIEAGTVVWAAGLKASSLTTKLGCELDRMGRVKVTPGLTVPDHPEVFVLGDLVHLEQDGELLPGVAQTALQSGAFAAEQITNDVLGYDRRARFVYNDKGSMATIGRAKAVAQVGSASISGFIAWLMWVFIHIIFLVDFRNRIAVVLEWAYAYWTWQRSARVIVDAPRRRRPRSERARILANALEPLAAEEES
ncbi:MAG: NAD(P)/FAD-dependent oxidoreductase, partial [Myxococcales bacterium]|nr:NAD(P)/FAD-dependent oxidoreductase [Myxococcales bacterium]